MVGPSHAPIFYDALEAQKAGEKVPAKQWLDAYAQEYDQLGNDERCVLLWEVCDVLSEQESWRALVTAAEQGLESAEEAVKEDKIFRSHQTQFLTFIAIAANTRGDLPSAENALLKAAEADPDEQYFPYWRLSLFMNLAGQYEKSVEYMERCMAHCPFKDLKSNEYSRLNGMFIAAFKSLHEKQISSNDLRGRIIHQWNEFVSKWTKYDKHNPELRKYMDMNLAVMSEKKCFIAAACIDGNCLKWEENLVLFRETVLKESNFGLGVIRLYEYLSPSIARRIYENQLLRISVKWIVVAPAQFMAKKCTGYPTLLDRRRRTD